MHEPEGTLLDEPSPSETTPAAGGHVLPRPISFASADLYRALLESMTEGVSLSDEAGVIVYTNPAEDALFGYEPGELVGRHVSVQNAYPEEENHRRVAEVIAQLKAHGHWQGEWLNRRKDGSTFVTASRITAVDLDGHVHWLCVQRDVTDERLADAERRRAEERLRESEERLRLAAAAARIGTWDFDLVSGRGRWDEEALRIGGLIGEEATYDALSWLRIVHPDDRDRVDTAFAASLSPGGPTYDVEFRCAMPADDGGYRWVTSHGAVMRHPETGEAFRAVGIIRDATARRRNLERLAEGEGKLRTLTNALPAFVWLAKPDGELHYFNDRWYEYTGQTPAEALPNGWADTLHPDDVGRTARAWAEARARGAVYEIEVRYRRWDGAYRWYVARAEPSRTPAGAITGWVGTSTDIHDRRLAEAALRESEQRLQLAKQAAGVGVWDWDLRTNAITWSREMYELLDIDPATPAADLFEAWSRAVHPDDREWTAAIARTSAGTGDPIAMDFRIVRRDGELRWLRSQGIAALGEDGCPIRLTGVNLDVSAQHQLEEELRGRAEQLAAAVEERTRERNRVFELSNDLFAAAGFDGYLKTVNPAWERLLGYSEAELLARPFIEIIHPEDHAAAAEVVAGLASGNPVVHFEDRLFRRDGQTVWVAWTAVPEGERFYAVGRDITREREREEILRQSQKMEAIGQLTGGVAHDFNNLLTPIVGALDLLQRRGVGGERERRLVDGAAQSADRARTLVERLLAFARRQPLRPIAVDVAQLAREMAALVSSTAGPRINVELIAADGLPAAKADPNQLEMAILNLSVNARDAMPEGGSLRIMVEPAAVDGGAAADLRPGKYIRLSVADTGIGMDRETLARAVEPFFSTKGIGKGTGLGLSMVHGLASQLGGALRLHSTPGLGTTVELWLPQSDAPIEYPDASPGVAVTHRRRGKVLLVDDEDLVRASVAEMLFELGYEVVQATSGSDALRQLREGLRPDLVVTDHLMPGLSGTELARRVQDSYPALGVLVVSGYADTDEIAPDLPRLRKPFRGAELAASIAALI